MDYVLHAYCGLYCGACPIMLNTKAGTGTDRCYGCKSEQTTEYCSSCSIRICAGGLGHEFCNRCPDYEGCARVESFLEDASWPYQRDAAGNMDSIRQGGLTQWLQAQERRWRCDHCGAGHSWRDETCPKCGQAIVCNRADP